jgi:hypothetical protein
MTSVERFWCPREKTYLVDAAGYLADPYVSALDIPVANPDVLATSDLLARRCLILLGEPGAGKSTAITDLTSASSGPYPPLSVDLSTYGSEERIVRDVLRSDGISEWVAGDDTLTLFLDSFDEAKARVPHLAAILATHLHEWPCDRLSLRIACRTADWPTTLEEALTASFEEVCVVEILPLRREDVRTIASAYGDPEPFLAAIEQAGAVPLASRPLTLKLLARDFSQTGTLPVRSADLYAAGVKSLCDEWNRTRRDAELRGTLSVDEGVSVAQRIAAGTVFGGRPTIWTGPLHEAAPDDMTVDEVAGGFEQAPNAQVSVTPAAIREVVRTGLFTSRGQERLGWAHSTFADYLAGRWIATSALTEAQARPLLLGPDGRAWPQTRLAAAWAVAIAPSEYGWLVREDPESFRGEVDLPGDELRSAVVDGLLASADRLQFAWRDSYRGLNHPGIAEQLRPELRSTSYERRRLAFELVRDCNVMQLRDDLAAIALDLAAPTEDRNFAGFLVAELPAESPTSALLPLVLDPEARGTDDQHELLGAGLLALWPHALSTEQVFDLLVFPPSGFRGTYWMFLDRFAQSLQPDDLEAALPWLEHVASSVDESHLAQVANAVLLLGLANIDRSGVEGALARIALVRADQYHGLLFQDFMDAPDALADAAVRRRLSRTILGITTDDKMMFRVADLVDGHSLGLVRHEDLAWLVDEYANADARAKEALWQLIRWTFDAHDPEHVDIVMHLPSSQPLVLEHLSEWLQPVRLDSEEADQLRRRWSLRQTGKLPEEPRRTDDINDTIMQSLERFAAGEVEGFWRAVLLMMIKPGATHSSYEFDPDMTSFPRWETLTDSEKARFVAAADDYLRTASCNPEEWVHKPSIRYYPADAGYRALVLLLRLEPERIRQLPAEVWTEWAPIIVEWSCLSNPTRWTDKKALLDTANDAAHDALVGVLTRRLEALVEAKQVASVHFEAEYLWDANLAAAVLRLAKLAPEPPRQQLVDLLATNDFDAVLPVLHEWLATASDDSDRAALAVRVLTTHELEASWPVLRVTFDAHPHLALQAFGSMEMRRHDQPLTEDFLADLYLWMRETFPPEEDPRFDDGVTVASVGNQWWPRACSVSSVFARKVREKATEAWHLLHDGRLLRVLVCNQPNARRLAAVVEVRRVLRGMRRRAKNYQLVEQNRAVTVARCQVEASFVDGFGQHDFHVRKGSRRSVSELDLHMEPPVAPGHATGTDKLILIPRRGKDVAQLLGVADEYFNLLSRLGISGRARVPQPFVAKRVDVAQGPSDLLRKETREHVSRWIAEQLQDLLGGIWVIALELRPEGLREPLRDRNPGSK